MKLLGGMGARASRQTGTDAQNVDDAPAVIGNGRMTALASAALLVLFVIVLVTLPALRALLTVHVLVGVLLLGPLAVKIGSTGYRFVRYYAGSPAFVRQGPPRPALRILAPLLLISTLALLGSGIGLLVVGPAEVHPLAEVHTISMLIWLPLIAIHVFAYIRLVPHRIADDWSKRPAERVPGHRLRVGAILGAVVAGAVAAVLVLPSIGPWTAWFKMQQTDLGPVLVGVILVIFAVLAAKLLRWAE